MALRGLVGWICLDLRDSVWTRLAHTQINMSKRVDLRHPHGKALDDDMGVEGLHDVSRHQAVVDALILVLFELRQLVLSYVHHDGGLLESRLVAMSVSMPIVGGIGGGDKAPAGIRGKGRYMVGGVVIVVATIFAFRFRVWLVIGASRNDVVWG